MVSAQLDFFKDWLNFTVEHIPRQINMLHTVMKPSQLALYLVDKLYPCKSLHVDSLMCQRVRICTDAAGLDPLTVVSKPVLFPLLEIMLCMRYWQYALETVD
ncbi:hypothetical protein AVEN_115381-1 [Araneus ventricosus]|uniref:Uncharacterized protein n=1 Tax=Araneus ventricosus TaxID=182803 RepID=A0A4Y2A078_ARAVE|nr:hypothetical protein AVEN_115381-1 [Araneus ventricosus]